MSGEAGRRKERIRESIIKVRDSRHSAGGLGKKGRKEGEQIVKEELRQTESLMRR
jgi:hypothetical protein